MAYPVGYTQNQNGTWTRTADSSGPYALGPTGVLYLLATGAVGVGSFSQANNGWWYDATLSPPAGPYAKGSDGNFYLAGNGDGTGGGIFSNIDITQGGSLEVFNTTPISATDYEKLNADWLSNIARIYTRNDGSGSPRALRVGASSADAATAPTAYTQYTLTGAPFIQSVVPAGGTAASLMDFTSGNLTAASGTQTLIAITPQFAQTGTAQGIALLVNPSGTFGSSGGKLQSWQLASAEVAQLTTGGAFYAVNVAAGLTGGIGWSSFGGSFDVSLFRDAANTLALRNGTSAQNSRTYNTYTDASNGEWLSQNFTSNVAYLVTEANGTGVARALVVGTNVAQSLVFRSSSTNRWEIGTAGHLFTSADNTYDIGASGATRPRNLFVANNAVIDGIMGLGGASAASTTILNVNAATTARSTLRINPGVAPTSPVNGDVWTTTTDLFIRLNGVTYTISKV